MRKRAASKKRRLRHGEWCGWQIERLQAKRPLKPVKVEDEHKVIDTDTT